MGYFTTLSLFSKWVARTATLLMDCIAVGSMLNNAVECPDTLNNACGVQAAVSSANNLPLLFCWPALPFVRLLGAEH